jgi:hypothetical protein
MGYPHPFGRCKRVDFMPNHPIRSGSTFFLRIAGYFGTTVSVIEKKVLMK